ncbi:MAG: class I SAM-dependent methyltransferase [Pseudomonadota bacterium]
MTDDSPADRPADPVAACADAQRLDEALRALLPGARLQATTLPLVPEIRLWLINADYPAGPLPPEVARVLMEQPPYWAFCWGSGAVLARWLLDHPERVRGRTVLDFGAGSGVVAVAAALAGARCTIACDIDPQSLAASRANARLNGVALDTVGDFLACEGDLDLVLAADVLYDRENLPLLARFRARATSVLVADSRVRNFAEPGYRRLWSQDCIAVPDLGEAEWVRHVTVYGDDQTI